MSIVTQVMNREANRCSAKNNFTFIKKSKLAKFINQLLYN